MKLIVSLCAFLFYSTAFAQEITGRLNVAKQIMAIYQEYCQAESEENKQAFELAASYIIHGEYNDMKEQMLKARSTSNNTDCHKSIDDFLN